MVKSYWAGLTAICALGLMAVLAQNQNQNVDMHGPVSQTESTQVASRAVKDGVYTSRQAERGKALYQTNCAGCHNANLSGGVGPALVGNAFKAKWNAKTVGDVFAYASTRMPPGKAGSLTAQNYADLLAYMLQVNGYPNGNSLLPPDTKALMDIAFDKAAQEAAVKAKAAQTPAQPPAAQTPQAQTTPGGARTAASGVYTAAQAERGKKSYLDVAVGCANCHSPELGGGPGAPGLVRGTFKLNWAGKTVGDLYAYAKGNMPPGRAGTLGDQTYADLIAFILQANNFPAGTAELGTKLDDLKQITIPK